MKKLLTTILLMGVALCGWATITETSSGSTVTLNYDGNGYDNFSLSNTSATTIVLTGAWTNDDLSKIGSIVGSCSNNVFLDLSACEGFVSKVQYPGTDWTGDNYQLVYSNSTQTVNVTKSTIYVDSNGNQYNGTVSHDNEGYYYEKWMIDGSSEAQQWQIDQANSGTLGAHSSWNTAHTEYTYYEWWSDESNHGNKHVLSQVKTYLTPKTVWSYQQNGQTIYVDESEVTQTSQTTGTATVPAQATPFLLDNPHFYNATNKLSGIAFPNSTNFTAIPDFVFGESGAQNLAIATNGSSVTWIGKSAFKNSKITTFDFNANLKVIGGEAFHGAPLTGIDLSTCTSLQAIKYEAFEECTSATTVKFPSGSNFTFLGNDAFRKTGITSLDMSMCTGITEFQHHGSSYRTFSECSALKTVKLPPYLKAIPDDSGAGVFTASKAIEYLEFTGRGNYVDCVLQNPCTIGLKAFEECNNLATIILSNNISYIGEEAFEAAAITEIHIPASVEELAKHCFYNCDYLTTVYFDEFDKTCGDCVGAATKIAGGAGAGGQGQAAFEECQAVADVYINTMAELQCGNNGFDQDITWGAGDAGAKFGMLHYPKEKIEHYVNLKHYLTDEIVADAGLFHDWLMEHYRQAIIPHKNGWYEFINSGPTIPNEGPELQEIVLRTFSDWDYAYLVPNGIRAYVVNKIEPVGNNYEVTLQRLRVIPKRTGVILYGHPNAKGQNGKPALVFTPVKFLEHGDSIFKIVDEEQVFDSIYTGPSQGAALCRANWGNLAESDMKYKNYLEPINNATGDRVAIKPYETVTVNGVKKITFRNFGLGRYTSTDYYKKNPSTLNDKKNYVGFFRMKAQNYNTGYAYLRLSGDVDAQGNALGDASEFPVGTSGEILVKPDEPDPDLTNDIIPYHYEYNMSSGKAYDAQGAVGDESLNPKRWWDPDAEPNAFVWEEMDLSWGVRSQALVNPSSPLYFGEFEEDADGVVKIVIPAGNEDGEYYTLQGVRVTNPTTKGVYIHNGKKVIIK